MIQILYVLTCLALVSPQILNMCGTWLLFCNNRRRLEFMVGTWIDKRTILIDLNLWVVEFLTSFLESNG